jgi:hypothetical protein
VLHRCLVLYLLAVLVSTKLTLVQEKDYEYSI